MTDELPLQQRFTVLPNIPSFVDPIIKGRFAQTQESIHRSRGYDAIACETLPYTTEKNIGGENSNSIYEEEGHLTASHDRFPPQGSSNRKLNAFTQ